MKRDKRGFSFYWLNIRTISAKRRDGAACGWIRLRFETLVSGSIPGSATSTRLQRSCDSIA